MNVEIRTVEPKTVAFIRMHGEYSQIPHAIRSIYMWAGMHGMQPAGGPSTLYYNAPEGSDQSACEWELYIPVAGDVAEREVDKKGHGVRHVDAQQMAVTMHKGPFENVAETYSALEAWLTDNGYRVVGSCEETYLSDPKDTEPEDYLTEIRFPVVKV